MFKLNLLGRFIARMLPEFLMDVNFSSLSFFIYFQRTAHLYWQTLKSLTFRSFIAMKHFVKLAVSIEPKLCKSHAGKNINFFSNSIIFICTKKAWKKMFPLCLDVLVIEADHVSGPRPTKTIPSWKLFLFLLISFCVCIVKWLSKSRKAKNLDSRKKSLICPRWYGN